MSAPLALGMDLGATRVRFCVGGRDGRFYKTVTQKLSFPESADDFASNIVRMARAMVEQMPRRPLLSGIGLACAGPLDIGSGLISGPVNLPYESVSIVAPFEDEFRLPAALLNDASAGALGEREFGEGKTHPNLVHVAIGTGIGGGAVLNGRLLEGKDGNAAEVGHTVVDPAGRLQCGCGRRGHWEAYCSGRGIPRLAELIANERATGIRGAQRLSKRPARPTAEDVLGAAREGDPIGKAVAAEVGRLNALGIANTVDMFDPSLVTLGGSVALNNSDLVLGPIRRLVPKLSLNRPPRIEVTRLGDRAPLLGALVKALAQAEA